MIVLDCSPVFLIARDRPPGPKDAGLKSSSVNAGAVRSTLERKFRGCWLCRTLLLKGK